MKVQKSFKCITFCDSGGRKAAFERCSLMLACRLLACSAFILLQMLWAMLTCLLHHCDGWLDGALVDGFCCPRIAAPANWEPSAASGGNWIPIGGSGNLFGWGGTEASSGPALNALDTVGVGWDDWEGAVVNGIEGFVFIGGSNGVVVATELAAARFTVVVGCESGTFMGGKCGIPGGICIEKLGGKFGTEAGWEKGFCKVNVYNKIERISIY